MLSNLRLLGLYASLITFLGVTAIVINGVAGPFDAKYGDMILGMRSESLTTFVEMLTYIGNWQTIVILCLLTMFIRKDVRDKFGIPVTIVAIVSSLANRIVKMLVVRPRPDSSLHLIEQGGWSFPSGHTTTIVAVCVMIAFIVAKCDISKAKKTLISLGLVILMTAVALSRIYLGVHFASDVFAGYALGLAVYLLVSMILFKKKSKTMRWSFSFLYALPTADVLQKNKEDYAINKGLEMVNVRQTMDNKKPILVVMAGGLGSRYGGLKQIDPVTKEGEIILDFSLFDAHRAGFDRAVLIIREETKEAFDKFLNDGARKHMQIDYAFQKVDDLPEGYVLSVNREKPWGTAHAIMTARNIVDAPFAVINADDYYGEEAFKQIYTFLDENRTEGSYAMISYILKNTVTDNGHVARGICQISDDGYLVDIVERTQIAKKVDSIEFTEDGETWTKLDPDTPVSMNFWGYTPTMMGEIEDRFEDFLRKAENDNILKAEYLIPRVTDELIKEGKASCKVLVSKDKWYGVTYKEDKDGVVEALANMKKDGKYPERLWQ